MIQKLRGLNFDLDDGAIIIFRRLNSDAIRPSVPNRFNQDHDRSALRFPAIAYRSHQCIACVQLVCSQQTCNATAERLCIYIALLCVLRYDTAHAMLC